MDYKNVENSEIGLDSETVTSNTWELVDSNFNQLSFIQVLGAEALVRGVGDAVPYESGGIGGRGDFVSPPIIEKKFVPIFFCADFGEIWQSSFPRFQTFFEQFETKMHPCFFHDFKYLINFFRKKCSKFSKNICLSKTLTFFGKV